MIYEFVKNKNGNRVGLILALSKKEIGWSLCSKYDKFNKEKAFLIAEGRARSGKVDHYSIPESIKYDFKKMEDRAIRYYK